MFMVCLYKFSNGKCSSFICVYDVTRTFEESFFFIIHMFCGDINNRTNENPHFNTC